MRIARYVQIIFLFCLITKIVLAQKDVSNCLEQSVDISSRTYSLKELFEEAELQLGIKFSYTNKLDVSKKVSLNEGSASLENVLNRIIDLKRFKYKVRKNKILIIPLSEKEIKFTIKGFVFDAQSSESLIGAHIISPLSMTGTVSNSFGFYSITLPAKSSLLTLSYVGYKMKVLNLNLKGDTTINIFLNREEELSTVNVLGRKAANMNNLTGLSTFELNQADINKIQATFGEADLFKGLQLLPGIQANTEASSGLVVRGGSPDQNLILLDDVPVYYVGHVLGIFSIFNRDAINKVKIIKGGFPARYGGRVSSVCDIRLKDGDAKELHGDFSLGLISAQFNLHGPIKKDKTTFHLSFRRTYLDLLLGPVLKIAKVKDDLRYFFGDVSFKVKHKINPRNQLFGSIYYGGDKLRLTIYDDFYDEISGKEKSKNKFGWGNFTSSIRWNKIFSDKLFANTSLIYSKYRFISTDEYAIKKNSSYVSQYRQDFRSGITDVALKTDLDYRPSPYHSIKSGAGVTFHEFIPGKETYVFGRNISRNRENRKSYESLEFYTYVEDLMQITKRFSANVGLRFNGIKSGEKYHLSLEPRLMTNYRIGKDINVKLGYSSMSQYLHRVTKSILTLPIDIWLPVTQKIKPIESDQLVLGISKPFQKNKYKVSIEGSYKITENILEFSQNFNAAYYNDSWENKVTPGKGRYSGIELMMQKNRGNWTGFMAYTLSLSKWHFVDLNKNQKFYSPFDRRHSFNINLNKEFSKKLSVSATWIYASGAPTTLQLQNIQAVNPHATSFPFSNLIRQYEQRNAYRMSPYHRLDLGIKLTKQKKKGTRIWEFNIYNAYWNNNPLYTRVSGNSGDYKIKQASLVGMIPTFRYTYKF
ncbi:hypothetical protein EMN47_19580 [Prolixibacteraceae bacterium JC049]|nr:hypothetical protein [Prolixibacteraceae bacterium JC049]